MLLLTAKFCLAAGHGLPMAMKPPDPDRIRVSIHGSLPDGSLRECCLPAVLAEQADNCTAH